MKNVRPWVENEIKLFAEVLADPENNFAISLEKLALKKPENNAVFEHIKNTFEMEMDNKFFKQNNANQVKSNATKLEYTNYCKNLSGSPYFYFKSFDIGSNYS